MTTEWHIITGEYPPQMGGVADYCRIVAEGLADAGCKVHVWTSRREPETRVDEPHPGLTVHRETEGWKSADFQRIGQLLDTFKAPRRILVQYAPNVFHRTGLNFGLARWLNDRRSRGDQIDLMVHEVTYIEKPGDPLRRRFLALAQRRLMSRMLGAADQVDIAIPYWERMLRPLDPMAGRLYRWLPVGSNAPVVDDPAGVASLRARLTSSGQSTVIGSFGTFATDVTALLAAVMPMLLLGRPDRAGVLIGRGSDHVAESWIRLYPELSGRLSATGALDHDGISRNLQACDLLVQPFPGGVCSKRTSLMAGLAHGVATVTTSGEVTEPIWAETGAVGLAVEGDAHTLIERSEAFLNDSEARTRLAISGLALYNNRFASRHTIESLIVERAKPAPAETACS